ncbi:MAG: hypothetical protein SAJ12_00935 [Jaaginema sp. PMC 1079.18]|nr:hypothetical protein [Jaaginema sp. PMC 1080.18]MEC4849549.1 hypothetical protein [Jaaginema sp. PMC 1079.18]MEC4867903.1 hypothetical protein [Jaaginema sp. PMC 1078.18]
MTHFDSNFNPFQDKEINNFQPSNNVAVTVTPQPFTHEIISQDDYIQGRLDQQSLDAQRQQIKRYENAGRELAAGIGLFSLLLMAVGLSLLPQWLKENPAEVFMGGSSVEVEWQ